MSFLGGLPIDPNQFLVTRWLFLRGLGLIYLIAFASMAVQVSGLIGEQGILPAGQFLDAVLIRTWSRMFCARSHWSY